MPALAASTVESAVMTAAVPFESIPSQRQERFRRESTERLRPRTVHSAELESALRAAHEENRPRIHSEAGSLHHGHQSIWPAAYRSSSN
jgi:hypothetical protein